MKEYDHKSLEEKWQRKWLNDGLYTTKDAPNKPKSYVLDMFPYPSGEGLHVGHPKGYIATDVYSRMKRMQGYNVLHPMGWDAFGLPAEQYALKNKVHPRIAVERNIARFKEQLEKIGFNYDWTREVNTTDPHFYKWTQWIFKQLFKKGLAYESHEPINWCPSCKTGLSNEDLDGDVCERCGTKVEKKPIRQWILKITAYADRMLNDLDGLNWPESIKESQRNWIGRSEGAEFDFALSSDNGFPHTHVTIFTTRPDTLFGASYVAIGADLAKQWVANGWNPSKEVLQYIDKTIEAQSTISYKDDPEKTGIETGIFATNPVNNEKIPVWIANYVLAGYGTGAIMAVPAHDERDFAFATKYHLPIRKVIDTSGDNTLPTVEEGKLLSSQIYTGKTSREAKDEITKRYGRAKVQYKLKDWVFARQRYWGEPFPIVFDHAHKPYVVADSELPVKLPEVTAYEPTGTGESPLANITDWVEVYGYLDANNEFVTSTKDDPKSQLFRRETNTMPQWAGSSWYYLRYIDPKNDTALISQEKDKVWSPVDFYVGGAEHATRHLIYARFWHKFLYDIGVVNYHEPFTRLQNVGLIQAEDGRKMSKRWGNVINPDDMIERFGADTLRVYEMFMGPFDQAIPWSTESMMGARRFIERIWRFQPKVMKTCNTPTETESLLHITVKKVSDDIESFAFNTAISQLMILMNQFEKDGTVSLAHWKTLLCLLAPFAPHVTEELWEQLGERDSIHDAGWPTYETEKLIAKTCTIAIQINGKLRHTLNVDRGLSQEEVLKQVKDHPSVNKWIEGKHLRKIIYVKDKILNIVLGDPSLQK